MTDPGPLLASGRDADVFLIDDDRVLRRYRHPRDTLHEAAVMQHVRERGYPAPEVFEAGGPNLVMERIRGRTMLASLPQRPWGIVGYAKMLADLHDRLHAIPGAAWMREWTPDSTNVVHADLHPDNVMLSPDGPVVIDWTNAARGAGDAAVAYNWLIIATSVAPVGPLERVLVAAVRSLFVRTFRSSFDLEAVRAWVPFAAEHRMADRNVLDVERTRIARFAQRWALSDRA